MAWSGRYGVEGFLTPLRLDVGFLLRWLVLPCHCRRCAAKIYQSAITLYDDRALLPKPWDEKLRRRRTGASCRPGRRSWGAARANLKTAPGVLVKEASAIGITKAGVRAASPVPGSGPLRFPWPQ